MHGSRVLIKILGCLRILVISMCTRSRLYACSLAVSEGLDEDQQQFQEVALEFAKNEMMPYMSEWDEKVFHIMEPLFCNY